MRPQQMAASVCVCSPSASARLGRSRPAARCRQARPQPPRPGAGVRQDLAGGRTAIEEYLRTGDIVSVEEIPVGVTRPTRCTFAPGGPVAEMTWKPIRPGHRGGFLESYRSEIAPMNWTSCWRSTWSATVEKRIKEEVGAAVMWVSPVKSFKQLGGSPKPPPAEIPRWSRQLSRAKLFDNLIANIDSTRATGWSTRPGT